MEKLDRHKHLEAYLFGLFVEMAQNPDTVKMIEHEDYASLTAYLLEDMEPTLKKITERIANITKAENMAKDIAKEMSK